MRKIFSFTVIIAAAFFTSCINMGERVNGNGKMRTENRQVGKTDNIRVLGDIDVFLSQGPTSVKVEADDNILPYVETKADGDWLEIKTRDNINVNTNSPIKVYVTTPDIAGVETTGSGDINFDKKFACANNVSFHITGSGDVVADLNAPKIDAHISGSGNLHIKGETRDADIHIAGSGSYDAPDLKTENASVSIAGSGDADLFAEVSLKASIAGSGNIKYRGNAAVDKSIAGSGTISKLP